MNFSNWLSENEDPPLTPELLMAKYEQQAMQSPQVQDDFKTRGIVLIATIQKVLGVGEGLASYISRELNKKYQNHEVMDAYFKKQYQPDRDNYYYHVTLKSRLPAIKKHGLQPWSEATFTNYQHNSRGRIFLTEKDGVGFWMQRVEEHEFHNTDNPQGVIVLRIKKDNIPNALNDSLGTKDSRVPAYYTVEPIPPQHIELVKKKTR